jgi:hypothetical protein
MYRPSRRLVKALTDHPTIDCQLSLGHYRRHADVREAFVAHLTHSLRARGIGAEDGSSI